MFYANFIDATGEEISTLYESPEKYFSDTFSPCTVFLSVLEFKISGSTYQERKNAARDLAIDFQHVQRPGLSWGEFAKIGDFFEEVGRRYGLIREYHENGII